MADERDKYYGGLPGVQSSSMASNLYTPPRSGRRSFGDVAKDVGKALVTGEVQNVAGDRDQILLQGTIQDAYKIKKLIGNEELRTAADVLVDRMNYLDDQGIDSKDTAILRDMLVGGNIPGVMNEIDTFLSGLPTEAINPNMVTTDGQSLSQTYGGEITATDVPGFKAPQQEQFEQITLADGTPGQRSTLTGKISKFGGGVNIVNEADRGKDFQVTMQEEAQQQFQTTPDERNARAAAYNTIGGVEAMASYLDAADYSNAEKAFRILAPDFSMAFSDPSGLQAAAQALKFQIAPKMRAVGSGSTSDVEFGAMLNSVPNLMQSKAGRRLIVEGFRAQADRAREFDELDLAYARDKSEGAWDNYMEEKSRLRTLPLLTDERKRTANRYAIDQGFEAIYLLPDVTTQLIPTPGIRRR
tara:strand:+ start:1651 stop:2892 length:1242 start_codon:yes stop_codon:yes gene_type:complete